MLHFPEINPIAFHVGPLSIYWYGLMYIIGLLVCWGLLFLRIKTSPFPLKFNAEQLSDIIFYAALGIIIGGRLGYMLFYNAAELWARPWSLFEIWKGGMSFHGGLIGVILAEWLYAYKIDKRLIDVTDFIAPVVPLGLAFGRLGNFINGELWGRPTALPWGMVFPRGGEAPRHPSQLYEFFFEGLLLFIILWIFSKKPRPAAATSGLFLIGYSIFRFSIEFFREPDPQKGFIALGWLTEGQLLSVPMFVLGIILLVYAYRGKLKCNSI